LVQFFVFNEFYSFLFLRKVQITVIFSGDVVLILGFLKLGRTYPVNLTFLVQAAFSSGGACAVRLLILTALAVITPKKTQTISFFMLLAFTLPSP